MFRAEDLHPISGRYKHIIIPPGVKKIKVTMKDGAEGHEEKPDGKHRVKLPYPRYRDQEH